MLVTIIRIIGGIIIVATLKKIEHAIFDSNDDYVEFYMAHHKTTNKEDE